MSAACWALWPSATYAAARNHVKVPSRTVVSADASAMSACRALLEAVYHWFFTESDPPPDCHSLSTERHCWRVAPLYSRRRIYDKRLVAMLCTPLHNSCCYLLSDPNTYENSHVYVFFPAKPARGAGRVACIERPPTFEAKGTVLEPEPLTKDPILVFHAFRVWFGENMFVVDYPCSRMETPH